MDETPVVIRVDASLQSFDMSLPTGSIFGIPLDADRTPLLIESLRDFGITRVVIDAPDGLEHPLAGVLKEAGLMVAAGNIQPA